MDNEPQNLSVPTPSTPLTSAPHGGAPYWLVVVLIILVAALGYHALANNYGWWPYKGTTADMSELTTTPSPSQLPNETNDPTAQWSTYTSELGFSIQYPSAIPIEIELNDEHNRLVAFGPSMTGDRFEVRLQRATDPNYGVLYGFLGAEITEQDVVIDGVTGHQAISVTGYGDAGHQGQPYVVYAASRNGEFYNIVFYGDATMSEEEEMILTSFTFLDESVGALCNLPPESTEMGSSVFPIASEYSHLHHLGQLFTAELCGNERLASLRGVEQGMYTLGSKIWLGWDPSAEIIGALLSIGYTCDTDSPLEQCLEWSFWDPVSVESLLRIKPFVNAIRMDDCRNCG